MNTTNSLRRIGIFVQDFWVALVSGCVLLGVLFFWLYLNNYKWTELSSFIQIETIVLIIIGAISTHNYSLSIRKLAEITDGETIWQQVLVTVCNVGFFTLAIFQLFHPTWHIFGIILIYAGFSTNNVLEIKALFSSALVNHVTARRQRIVDRNIWLRNENVPAIIGFTVIAITLCVLILLEYPDSQGEQVIKSLKAFAAGAATLHLSLSVLKYLTIQMLKDDILEVAIGFMQWHSDSIEWLESLNNSTSKWAKLAAFSVVVASVAATVGALRIQRKL